MDRLIEDGHKSKKTFKPIQICTVINLGRYNKICQLTKIMNRSLYLIKDAMPYMEKPKIVYKNLNNNGVKFMNHKRTALELVDKNTYKNMNCKCAYNKNGTVKRDGHINTGNMDIVKFILHKDKYVMETIEELKLGVKFIPKPNIDKMEITKIYTEAIEIYKNKINKIKKSKDLASGWAKKVISDLEKVIQKADIKIDTCENQKRRHIMKNIRKIQKYYVITCIDKMPNNYCVICKKH